MFMWMQCNYAFFIVQLCFLYLSMQLSHLFGTKHMSPHCLPEIMPWAWLFWQVILNQYVELLSSSKHPLLQAAKKALLSWSSLKCFTINLFAPSSPGFCSTQCVLPLAIRKLLLVARLGFHFLHNTCTYFIYKIPTPSHHIYPKAISNMNFNTTKMSTPTHQ